MVVGANIDAGSVKLGNKGLRLTQGVGLDVALLEWNFMKRRMISIINIVLKRKELLFIF